MNGSHLVKISRRRGTKYTFTIKRNITIVRGDSGTGKTTLFDMVADYMRTGRAVGRFLAMRLSLCRPDRL